MAAYLALALGLSVDTEIVQTNRVEHAGASGSRRLATPVLFDGDVLPGETYLLVDYDFLNRPGGY